MVSSKKAIGKEAGIANIEKIAKHNEKEETSDKGKSTSGAPSPRTACRRYKSLKDVMC